MANQQVFPQSVYPIDGDVASTPGSPLVTVEGIQNTPVLAQAPQDGQILIYDAPINAYVPGDPIVSGPNAPGTSPTTNPVQVGGQDEGNLVRELRLDTYGGVRSVFLEEVLNKILLELRAVKAAIVNLDNTAMDADYQADDFSETDLGQGV